jgi:hypothetical protein
MIAYCYYFHQSHPEIFAECPANPNSVRFHVNDRLACDAKFFPTSLGNLTLSVPEDIVSKLNDGTGYFDVTSSFTDYFAQGVLTQVLEVTRYLLRKASRSLICELFLWLADGARDHSFARPHVLRR